MSAIIDARRTLNVFPRSDIATRLKSHGGQIDDARSTWATKRSESPRRRGSQQIGELGRRMRCSSAGHAYSPVAVYPCTFVYVCMRARARAKPPNSFGHCKDAVDVTH